ncbi:MAG: helix-turn-helix domain-containing protein [Halobacteriales archaeon]
MPDGIRATVEFTTPDICPIVELSETAGTTIDSVNSNICPSECQESTVEFSIDTNSDLDTDLTPMFSHGSTDRYRLTLGDGTRCPCKRLARRGCPVTRYVAEDGALTLVFHTTDYDQLRDAVAELRELFPDINIKRFVRGPAGERSHDPVFVDRSRLTHRQLEVVETAYEMGYFDRPRQSNATEIAAELGINPATFREHLTAAESKILEDLL